MTSIINLFKLKVKYHRKPRFNRFSGDSFQYSYYFGRIPFENSPIYFQVNKYIEDNYDYSVIIGSYDYFQAANSYILTIITQAQSPNYQLHKNSLGKSNNFRGHKFEEYYINSFKKIRKQIRKNPLFFEQCELKLHNIRFGDLARLLGENRQICGVYEIDGQYYAVEFTMNSTFQFRNPIQFNKESLVCTSVNDRSLITNYIFAINQRNYRFNLAFKNR